MPLYLTQTLNYHQLTKVLFISFSNPGTSPLCLEAFLRLLSTSSSSNFFRLMEREELRRGVLRPARPAGREMGTGVLGKVLGGKDDIVLLLKRLIRNTTSTVNQTFWKLNFIKLNRTQSLFELIEFGTPTKSNTEFCMSSISKPLKLNQTKLNPTELNQLHCNQTQPSTIQWIVLYCVWTKFWTKIVLCDLKTTKTCVILK